MFGSFIGITRASDFSPASMSGVRPLAFPDPPAANCSAGTDEISQFLFRELLRMLRVFDRVGPAEDSRVAPSPVWPSTSLNSVGAPDCLISRLNGWPALSPVNASMAPSRTPPHDSGPGWFATPFLCRTFINYSLPVSWRTKRPLKTGDRRRSGLTTSAASRRRPSFRSAMAIRAVLRYSRRRVEALDLLSLEHPTGEPTMRILFTTILHMATCTRFFRSLQLP